MILKNIFKKSALSIGLLTIGMSASQAVELNEVDEERANVLKQSIVKQFTEGQPTGAVIREFKRLDNSDNYLFKYEENGNYYTMMYIEDINSVFIQATGEIYSLTDKNFVTKKFNADFTKTFISEMEQKDFITFEANNPEVAEDIFVFTDPTCGYCQKLHREIKEYQEQNINVHYLPFPRGGLSGYGYEQLVNTFCSADRKAAMKESKISKTIPALAATITPQELESCKNTVAKYYNLGSKMGVKGTPAIFSKNGTQLGGYIPAQQLRYSLSQDK